MADDAPTPADIPAGIPDPNPTLPDASTEPVTQVASATANSVAPPLPADYEMPDDYAAQDPMATAKAWVEAHPGLAILGAAGIGLVAGRLVMALIPDPDPPSLADRVETRAKQLKKVAKKQGKVASKEASAFAHSAGDTLQDSLHRASEALREAASNAGGAAEEGYEKTKDLAETIADAAKVAVTGVMAAKLDDWVSKVRS